MLENKIKVGKSFKALFNLFSVFWVLSNYNLLALAEDAKKAAAANSGGGSTMMIVAGVAVLVVGGAVGFVAMSKKPSGGSKNDKIEPPKSSSAPTVKAPATPTVKAPVVAPTPKSPTSSTSATGPLQAPEIKSAMPSPPVSEPVMPSIPTSAPVLPTPTSNTSSGGLFDSNKLSSDLDTIFKDEGKKDDKKEAAKKAPLFDSSQLDSDLDSLFVEVNKKPEPQKQPEKSGLFDSNQLDSDLDSLFSTPAATPAPSTPAPTPAFSLDSLDFMSSPTPEAKKEEAPAPTPAFSLDSLDSLTTPAPAPAKQENNAFNLDSLDFLSSPPKEEKKEDNSSFALPSFDLSSITSPTPAPKATQPDLSSLSAPADKIDLSTTTMGINISDYLSSINAAPAPKEAAKQEGNISIGKMTVDQSALEEIIKKAEKGGKAGLTTTQVITAVKGKTLDTLLVDINNVQGIKGSMIVGKDGLVIANTMTEDVDKDLVGALTSSLFTNIDNQIKKIRKGNLKKLTVETELGIYILTEIDMGTLVVFSQDHQKINFANVFKAISSVTGRK
ncbi:MAG: roadblock/LC7 domain-containing protein [Candidatus Sericytochromatia bacterium]